MKLKGDREMKAYTVERTTTFFYMVDAKDKDDAIATAEDMGESQAQVSSTGWKVRQITDKMISHSLTQGRK